MTEQMDAIDTAQQKEIEDLKHKDEIHDLLLEQYKEHNDLLKNVIYGGMFILAMAMTIIMILFMMDVSKIK